MAACCPRAQPLRRPRTGRRSPVISSPRNTSAAQACRPKQNPLPTTISQNGYSATNLPLIAKLAPDHQTGKIHKSKNAYERPQPHACFILAALVAGSKIIKRRLSAILKSCVNCDGELAVCCDPTQNAALKREINAARRDGIPDGAIARVMQLARQGIEHIDVTEFTADWDSEAYATVSGQNANNSVRVSDAFMKALMAQFPSKEVAERSYAYRTLGLGYANLGGLLMRSGIAYDSEAGRAAAGAITALLSGIAYQTSSEMAQHLGAFPRHAANAEPMMRVIQNHRRAAEGRVSFDGLSYKPLTLDRNDCPYKGVAERAAKIWKTVQRNGKAYGFRNAQVSVIAPTGTIGLLMDCDTTGIEPDFALVKIKKLAGGGHLRIINQAVPLALKSLGYKPVQRDAIITYALGHGTLDGSPAISFDSLKKRGFSDYEVEKITGRRAAY